VYVISVAAELAGMHPQTLRLYERKGLVGPWRTGGGNRRYSDDDIDRLRHIAALTAAGLNLEGARRVLELEAELERLREELQGEAERLRVELERVRSEARDTLERTHRQYRRDLVPLRQATVLWSRGGTAAAPRAGRRS
jgi:MerR family transcriptional regulator/heat shock protein HspR